MVFLACQTMEGQPITVIPEIWNELRDNERKPYARRLVGRASIGSHPRVSPARQVLFDIVERETAQITVKADAHRHRAEVIDALTADCLLFDDSPAGERLRRYELANGRAVWRSLDALHKHRRVVSGQLSVVSGPLSDSSVVSGPLSVVNCRVDAVAEQSATNEATGGPLSVVSGPLPVAGCDVEAVDEANAPNEPTDGSRKRDERTHRGSGKRDERTHRGSAKT